MAGRWLDLRWALSVLCVLLMVETVPGARGPSTGAHISPQFPASGVNQTPVVDCRKVCGLNVSDRCDFIRTNPDCHSDGGYLDYLEGIFCHFPPHLLPLAVTLYVSWLLYLFLILGVTAAKFFCPNLSAISTTLKLSHNVAGVTFLAFGNGAPDIFSALVAFSDPHTAGLALGALFGAGVLVTTVVAGGITILHPFMAASRPFFRDIVFYMVAVFLTFIMLFRGRVTLPWALGYLGFYVFYVVTVILCTWIYRWQRRGSLVYSMPVTPEILSDSEEDRVSSNTNSYDYGDEYWPLLFYQETTAQILARALNPLDYMKWRRKSAYWKALKVFKLPVEFLLLLTVPVVDPDRDDRNWKRPLNCLHLVISPLVIILTLQSGTSLCFPGLSDECPVDQRSRHRGGEHPAVPGRGLPAEQHRAGAHTAGVGEQHWRGDNEGMDDPGGPGKRLTDAGPSCSHADAFSDFTLARQGYPRMAFSACFGGIIFNILVGVGLGCLLQISRSHTDVKLEPDGLLVWVLAGALGLSLVFSLVSVPLQCFRLSRVYGFCLLLFYLNFLVVALLTEFGVIHLKSM
ncbi:mitochondrial sodium/calcium exchanger protein isoform X2 [Callithrix jacchus]